MIENEKAPLDGNPEGQTLQTNGIVKIDNIDHIIISKDSFNYPFKVQYIDAETFEYKLSNEFLNNLIANLEKTAKGKLTLSSIDSVTIDMGSSKTILVFEVSKEEYLEHNNKSNNFFEKILNQMDADYTLVDDIIEITIRDTKSKKHLQHLLNE